MKKFFEYLYVVIAFAVSCFLFFVMLLVIAAAIPGESAPLGFQLFLCCGLLYPVIVIISYLIVVLRIIRKQRIGIFPILPIIYFFTYMTIFVLMIIIT